LNGGMSNPAATAAPTATTRDTAPRRRPRVGVPRLLVRLATLGHALRRKVIELAPWPGPDGATNVTPAGEGAQARRLGFDPEAVHRAVSNATQLILALLARFELRAKRKPRASRPPSAAVLAKRAEAAAQWAEKMAAFDASGLDERYRPLKRGWGVPADQRRGRRRENHLRRMNLALTIIDMTDAEVVEKVCRELSAAARLIGEAGTAEAIEALDRKIVRLLAADAQWDAEWEAAMRPPGDGVANAATPDPPHWRPPDKN
jgi:hypothetical protein